jgi:hypothetical protein
MHCLENISLTSGDWCGKRETITLSTNQATHEHARPPRLPGLLWREATTRGNLAIPFANRTDVDLVTVALHRQAMRASARGRFATIRIRSTDYSAKIKDKADVAEDRRPRTHRRHERTTYCAALSQVHGTVWHPRVEPSYLNVADLPHNPRLATTAPVDPAT